MDRLNLTYDDWASLGKGALVAAAGAVLTYTSEHLSAQDFGMYGPMAAAVLAIVVNYFRKVLGVTPATPVVPDEPEVDEPVVDEEVGDIEIDDSFPEEGEFGGSDDKPLNDKSVK